MIIAYAIRKGTDRNLEAWFLCTFGAELYRCGEDLFGVFTKPHSNNVTFYAEPRSLDAIPEDWEKIALSQLGSSSP